MAELTDAQLRALRILADSYPGWVMESNRNDEDVPMVAWQSVRPMEQAWLADRQVTPDGRAQYWRIRPKGRQVLAEHDEAGA